MSIGSISRAAAAYSANTTQTARTAPKPSFTEGTPESSDDFAAKLGQAVDGVNEQQTNADSLLAELASAERVDLHGTMIAMEKADIALRTMVSVRDKAIAAYEQIMNMAI